MLKLFINGAKKESTKMHEKSVLNFINMHNTKYTPSSSKLNPKSTINGIKKGL